MPAKPKDQDAIAAFADELKAWVLLYEPVLHHLVDSTETMRDQLLRMVEASRLPNVTVQILPTAQHAWKSPHGGSPATAVRPAMPAWRSATPLAWSSSATPLTWTP